MSHSIELPRGAAGEEPPAEVLARRAVRPNLTGDLDGILVTPPAFRTRPRGYDRLQVDNYVAWAELEVQSSRRETDDLLERYGGCRAELELARRLLAHSPGGQEMARLSERIGSMLQLAADEAAEVTGTAAAEADRLLRCARADADAVRREAQELREVAAAEADQLTRAAEAERDQAADARRQALADAVEQERQAGEERARQDAEAAQVRARLDAEAAAVRERLDREAAERRDRDAAEAAEQIAQQAEAARARREAEEAEEAAALDRLTRVRAEVAELERRQAVACSSLDRMSDQLSEAVAALAASLPEPGLRLAPPERAAS
jgi:colicin import membrane protein